MYAAGAGREVVQAIRALRRTPSLVAVIVLCLGIGIGANTTVLSWMEEMVLRPVPAIRDPGRLVAIWTQTGSEQQSLSYPAYAEIRDASRTLSSVGAFSMARFGLQDPQQPGAAADPVWGMYASANYFDVLGTRPLLGRTFVPGEDAPGAASPVALLGYGLWQRRFAADSTIVGRQVRLNGHDLTIVGVLPPTFTGTFAGLSFDVWVPLSMAPLLGDSPDALTLRRNRFLQAFGRLAPGAGLPQARTELGALWRRIGAGEPWGRPSTLTAFAWDAGPGERFMRPVLTILLGVTALVLLVVCSNVASLLLARGAARQRELGVRAALGASRTRLVRQLMIEGALLALAGGVAAIGVAAWGRSILTAVVPGTPLPLTIDPQLDVRVLLFTAAIALGGCMLFALLPALRISRLDVVTALRSGATAGAAHSRLREALVVAQVAIAFTAIACAGLFIRSTVLLRRIDPGFRDAGHVLLFPMDLSLAGIRDAAAQQRLVTQLLERVRALPGVRSAALASQVPLGFEGGPSFTVRVPGYAPRADESMSVLVNRVSGDYFRTMGIGLVNGRAIDDRDREDASKAVVVNAEFARRYFGGRPAVGQRIYVGWDATIVGVVRDGKYDFDKLDQASPPFMYVSETQFPQPQLTLHARVDGDPSAAVAAIRRELTAAAPTLPVVSPLTLREYTSASLLATRLGAIVVSALGGIALLLSAIGLYGRLAYAVTQRAREIGVRLAVGASPRQVTGAILKEGARITGVGALVGLALAIAASRALSAVLPRMPTIDVIVIAGATGLLAAIALAASYVPARRAARIDPLTALRME